MGGNSLGVAARRGVGQVSRVGIVACVVSGYVDMGDASNDAWGRGGGGGEGCLYSRLSQMNELSRVKKMRVTTLEEEQEAVFILFVIVTHE